MRHRSSGASFSKGKKLNFPPIIEESPPPSSHAKCSAQMASPMDPMESAASRQPWLAEVMAAIATCPATLTAKIEAVQMDVGLLRQDMDKLRTRVTEMKQRVSHTDTVTKHNAALRSLQTKGPRVKG